MKELLKQVKSRGLKQRMKKRIQNKFNLKEEQEAPAREKSYEITNKQNLSNSVTGQKSLKKKVNPEKDIQKIKEDEEDPEVISLLQRKVENAWKQLQKKKLNEENADEEKVISIIYHIKVKMEFRKL